MGRKNLELSGKKGEFALFATVVAVLLPVAPIAALALLLAWGTSLAVRWVGETQVEPIPVRVTEERIPKRRLRR